MTVTGEADQSHAERGSLVSGRRWQATLLLISFVVVLFGLRAVAGGRTYAAGIAPHSFTAALRVEPRPFQDTTGHQLRADCVTTPDGPGRLQRWRETPQVQPVVVPTVTMAPRQVAVVRWRPADDPKPVMPARAQPHHPRGP